MKLNFRQGIHHAPMVSGHPSFLFYNPTEDIISVSAGVDLVRVSAAWYDVNYLIEEHETADDVWGPFTTPLTTYYLYWDINLSTGVLGRGFTILSPGYGEFAPIAPAVDQHWFDTTINVMKVWNGNQWVKKIRVFAATYQNGVHNITEYDLGTQVGIYTAGTQDTWFDSGYILYGIDQKAIRNSDGTLVTTAVPLHTYHGSFSSPIRLELSNSTALAAEPIPAFAAISNVGEGSIQLASGTNPDKRPIGIVTIPVPIGAAADIVNHGIVYNDQWQWDYTLGKDLYCGPTGLLFQGGSGLSDVRVGVILDVKTVLIDIDLAGTSSGSGSGASGYSGFSGYSGVGTSGYSGVAGTSGYSGNSTSGFSGYSGISINWPLRAPTEFNYPGVVPFSFIDSTTTGLQIKNAVQPAYDSTYWIATVGQESTSTSDLVYGESIAYDSTGNVYTIGGNGSYQGSHPFICLVTKHDSTGNLIWKKSFSSPGTEGFNGVPPQVNQQGESIAIDPLDNIYLAMNCYQYSITNGTNFVSNLVKINSSGQVIWQTQLDALQTYGQTIHEIAIDSIGDIVVCGAMATAMQESYVAKVNSSGTLLWAVKLTGSNTVDTPSYPLGIDVDSANNILVSGIVYLDAIGNTPARFLAKLDSSGTPIWVKSSEGALAGVVIGYGISVDRADNSIYQAVSSNANSGVSTKSVISKFDSSGTIVWETALDTSDLMGVVANSTGVYVTGNTNDGTTVKLIVAKFANADGTLLWQRIIKNPLDSYQHYANGTRAIAIYGTKLAVTGYTFALNSQYRAIIAQLGTDGSRIDTYSPFTYEASVIGTLTSDIITSTATLVKTALSFTPSVGLQQIGLIDYTSLKSPVQPSIVGDEFHFSRETAVSLKLISINEQEVVEIESANLGLKFVPTQASPDIHLATYDDNQYANTLRVNKGFLQTKLEMSVESNPTLIAMGGSKGFQSISPYQIKLYGPDLNHGGSSLTIDYSLGTSAVLSMDPVLSTNTVVPTNGLAGQDYEFIYKFASSSPEMTVFYKYPQGGVAFYGPCLIVATTGICAVGTCTMSDGQTYYSYLSGRPKEIAVSNHGNALDTAFVSTNINTIEMLKDGIDGCRIIEAASEVLNLSPSQNSLNNMDGFMWMNPVTNLLYAVGLVGDIWIIDSTIANPVEQIHTTIPLETIEEVYAINGDSVINALYVLYRNNLQQLVLCTINCATLEKHYTLLDHGGAFALSVFPIVNNIIVDPLTGRVYISASNGVNLCFIALSINSVTFVSTFLTEVSIALSKNYSGFTLVKSTGVVRPSNVSMIHASVYIPHINEYIAIDTVTWNITVRPFTDGIRFDQIILDGLNINHDPFVIMTSSHNGPLDNLGSASGIIWVDTNDTVLAPNYSVVSNRNFTFATAGIPLTPTGSVANYAALPSVGGASGDTWVTLDTGISWMLDVSFGRAWFSINEMTFFSEPNGYQFNEWVVTLAPGASGTTGYNVRPTPLSPAILKGNIRFPDHGVIDSTGTWFTDFPVPTEYNETWIAKLTKAAFYDNIHHEQSFAWYCTGLSGPYTFPMGV